MKKPTFHGILAVGRTKADAINNYRLLAMGKGAAVQVDGERSLSFVTHASSADGMFNPHTGNMDLETDEQLLGKVEFQSQSSGEVTVNHLVCHSGCGCHIVFESESLAKFCPNCTSSLSDDGEGGDEGDDDLESDSDDDLDDEIGGADDEGDDEGEDDEDSDDLESDSSDDDKIVAVASTLQEALQMYQANKLGLSVSSSQESNYVVCAGDCGGHIISDVEVTSCPHCHGAVQEPSLSDDSVEVPITDADAGSDEDEGEGEDDADSGADEGEDDDTDTSESSDDSEEGGEDEGEGGDADADAGADEGEDEGDESAEDEDNTLGVTDDEGTELNEKTEDLDASADVEEDTPTSDVDVSYSSSIGGKSAWTLYVKGTPVAMATASSAGKNADIFDSPAFGQAVLATAKIAGVKKAMSELGFAGIKHKVSVSKEIQRMVQKEVAEKEAALASEQKQFQDKFMAALATAAIGLNRGFFQGKSNPLKSALWNSLNSAGIANPEVMIDNVFANHNDAYHKVLFAQASEIVAKPVEVQESLSKTILDTNYMRVSSESSEGQDNVEDRLAGMGTSVSSATKSEVQPEVALAPSERQKISSVVSTLGRRGR